eukprot:7049477-Prymnesium_polylepis.1
MLPISAGWETFLVSGPSQSLSLRRHKLVVPRGLAYLWPMVRRKAVSSASCALRCRVWHEIRVDERTDR